VVESLERLVVNRAEEVRPQRGSIGIKGTTGPQQGQETLLDDILGIGDRASEAPGKPKQRLVVLLEIP
jgi:hypothetical protein